ncbi:MAG: HEPN domain-containing protein [Nitrososphaerota archaeon]
MSGEYVERLKRRALGFLREAKSAEDSDLAAFFAEQAMNLYIEAAFYEIFGERIVGHGLRSLLGRLSENLRKHEYFDEAERISGFVDEHRRWLILAEDTYTGARYGDMDYSRDDAEALRKVARNLIEVLDQVVENVKLD